MSTPESLAAAAREVYEYAEGIRHEQRQGGHAGMSEALVLKYLNPVRDQFLPPKAKPARSAEQSPSSPPVLPEGKCSECKGTGRTWLQESGEVECSHCEGSGQAPEGKGDGSAEVERLRKALKACRDAIAASLTAHVSVTLDEIKEIMKEADAVLSAQPEERSEAEPLCKRCGDNCLIGHSQGYDGEAYEIDCPDCHPDAPAPQSPVMPGEGQ